MVVRPRHSSLNCTVSKRALQAHELKPSRSNLFPIRQSDQLLDYYFTQLSQHFVYTKAFVRCQHEHLILTCAELRLDTTSLPYINSEFLGFLQYHSVYIGVLFSPTRRHVGPCRPAGGGRRVGVSFERPRHAWAATQPSGMMSAAGGFAQTAPEGRLPGLLAVRLSRLACRRWCARRRGCRAASCRIPGVICCVEPDTPHN